MEMALEVIWPTPARGSRRSVLKKDGGRAPNPLPGYPCRPAWSWRVVPQGERVGMSGHTAHRDLASKQSLVPGRDGCSEAWLAGT